MIQIHNVIFLAQCKCNKLLLLLLLLLLLYLRGDENPLNLRNQVPVECKNRILDHEVK